MLAVEKWLLSRWEIFVPSIDTTGHASKFIVAIEERGWSRNEILVQSTFTRRHKYPNPMLADET